MSELNVLELDTIFAPPVPPTGVPTSQQMYQMSVTARVKAKMALDYAIVRLHGVEARLKTVDAEINSNPATASDGLRKEQHKLGEQQLSFGEVINTEYPDYMDNVQAWYANMTSGSAYVALDKWSNTLPSSYPHLFATMSQVTF